MLLRRDCRKINDPARPRGPYAKVICQTKENWPTNPRLGLFTDEIVIYKKRLVVSHVVRVILFLISI